MYDYYTRVEDSTLPKEKRKGVMLMVHGFNQTSDTWLETQIQLAYNGWVCFSIDLEGYGYSSGNRITNLSLDKMHH